MLLYVLAHLRTILPAYTYSTITGSPVPPLRLSVSLVGFIPDAAHSSGNLPTGSTITKVNSVETIMCIVSFYIGNNYRDLIAALSVRSTLTDSPVASFTTRPLRATQHATGLMVKVARFSHREASSHRNSSLAGHTHCIAKIGARQCKFSFNYNLDSVVG